MREVVKYLRSLPDAEIVEPVVPGLLLNHIRRQVGYQDATLMDINRERSRRSKLRRLENAFGLSLFKIERTLELPEKTLMNAYREVRDSHPMQEAFPMLEQQLSLPVGTLDGLYKKVDVPKKVMRKAPFSPRSPRKVAKAKVAEKTTRKPQERASKKLSPTTILAIRQLFLDGLNPTEIYKSQTGSLLAGCGHIIQQGHITYVCTNLRQAKVGWPVLGEVTEVFEGRDAYRKAARVLRQRYKATLNL